MILILNIILFIVFSFLNLFVWNKTKYRISILLLLRWENIFYNFANDLKCQQNKRIQFTATEKTFERCLYFKWSMANIYFCTEITVNYFKENTQNTLYSVFFLFVKSVLVHLTLTLCFNCFQHYISHLLILLLWC